MNREVNGNLIRINLAESDFAIKKEDFDNALTALKDTFSDKNFCWGNSQIITTRSTISGAFAAIGIVPIYDNEGNICNVNMYETVVDRSEYSVGDEKTFFDALAPYVKPNSYLSFVDEDGYKWSLIFNGKECAYSDYNDRTSFEEQYEYDFE